MIPSQRSRFAIPDGVHYLNCAYMAPLAKEVSAAMAEGARLKEQPWSFRPADFFSIAEEFRSRAARLAGAEADCIAIVPSASYALAIAARNLPFAWGQHIVTLAWALLRLLPVRARRIFSLSNFPIVCPTD